MRKRERERRMREKDNEKGGVIMNKNDNFYALAEKD